MAKNDESRLKLIHLFWIVIVAIASISFWAGRMSMKVDVNARAIIAVTEDIKYIRNYLMGWEPDNATQTQSAKKDQAHSSP